MKIHLERLLQNRGKSWKGGGTPRWSAPRVQSRTGLLLTIIKRLGCQSACDTALKRNNRYSWEGNRSRDSCLPPHPSWARKPQTLATGRCLSSEAPLAPGRHPQREASPVPSWQRHLGSTDSQETSHRWAEADLWLLVRRKSREGVTYWHTSLPLQRRLQPPAQKY